MRSLLRPFDPHQVFSQTSYPGKSETGTHFEELERFGIEATLFHYF
jgi:hypothetical protein